MRHPYALQSDIPGRYLLTCTNAVRLVVAYWNWGERVRLSAQSALPLWASEWPFCGRSVQCSRYYLLWMTHNPHGTKWAGSTEAIMKEGTRQCVGKLEKNSPPVRSKQWHEAKQGTCTVVSVLILWIKECPINHYSARAQDGPQDMERN